MAIPHNRAWDDIPEWDEGAEIDAALNAELDFICGPTGEDFFLEEQFEDMTSGTMFDNYDD
jgi:hypothetical protein